MDGWIDREIDRYRGLGLISGLCGEQAKIETDKIPFGNIDECICFRRLFRKFCQQHV